MPRRKEYRQESYEGYAINSCAEMPVYLDALKRILDMIKACEGNRWEVVHTVIWLADEVSSVSPVLRKLQRGFSPGCLRYVWAKEDAPHKEISAPRRHFHLAVFYDAQLHSFSTLTGCLAGLVGEGMLQNYKVIRPDKSKIDQVALLDYLKNAPDARYGLDLRDARHVSWAVYWCSYLAKVSTKEKIEGRVFGSTSIRK